MSSDVKDVTEFKEDLKELKPPKVLVESEGFMNALSTQAAKMKEKKVKKPPGKVPKPGRTNSTSGIASETKPAATKEEDTTEPAEGTAITKMDEQNNCFACLNTYFFHN